MSDEKKTESSNGGAPGNSGTPAGTAAGAAAASGDGAPEAPPIVINGQYTKDLSFEAPSTPEIFQILQEDGVQPDIKIKVDVKTTPVVDAMYEVTLDFKATCKAKDKVAFIVELVYGGVFTVNVPAEHLQPVLLIECPRLLFPFARNILADTTRDGGFPPLMLGPIDFVGMFERQVQEAQAAQGKQPETS